MIFDEQRRDGQRSQQNVQHPCTFDTYIYKMNLRSYRDCGKARGSEKRRGGETEGGEIGGGWGR